MADTLPFPATPPAVRSQQTAAPAPVFMMAGRDQMMAQRPGMQQQPGAAGNPIQQLKSKLGELETLTGDLMILLRTVHPPSGALLVPIAQAGKALMSQVAEIEQRASGALPSGSEGAPVPTPAEGAPRRAAA